MSQQIARRYGAQPRAAPERRSGRCRPFPSCRSSRLASPCGTIGPVPILKKKEAALLTHVELQLPLVGKHTLPAAQRVPSAYADDDVQLLVVPSAEHLCAG
jgi:hypothetical protein